MLLTSLKSILAVCALMQGELSAAEAGDVAVGCSYEDTMAAEAKDEALNSATTQREDIPPMLTTSWNQCGPYNDRCPEYSPGERCNAGCVAVAAGQVMRYFCFPEKGAGSRRHSDEVGGRTLELTADFGDTLYGWSAMKDSYEGDEDEESCEAVALLMEHLGISFAMDYASGGANSSATMLATAGVGMIRDFLYSQEMRLEDRRCFSDKQWDTLIYEELRAGRPVLFKAEDEGKQHAFVCDGYDAASGKYHFNWGWGGKSNGYYPLSDLAPAHGANNEVAHFNLNQQVIVGIRPRSEGDGKTPSVRTYGGVMPGKGEIDASGLVTVKVARDDKDCFYSYILSEGLERLVMGLELTSAETGERHRVASHRVDALRLGEGYRDISVKWSRGLVPDGLYEVRPIAALCDAEGALTTDWEYVRIPVDGETSFRMSIDDDRIRMWNANTAEYEGIPDTTDDEVRIEGRSLIYAGIGAHGFSVMDLAGRTVARGIVGGETLCAPLSGLVPGLYLICCGGKTLKVLFD